jgi:tRNA modification GTPase
VGELCRAVASALEQAAGGADAAADAAVAPGTERQRALIEAAASSLTEAISLAGRGEPLDAAASLLRESVDALGEITGEASGPDVLERIFSQFCVGK